MPPPIWICSQRLLGCTHSPRTFGMVPWSQCPIHYTAPLEGCNVGALRYERWCSRAANILTPSDEFFSVFIHRGPEESALTDLCLCAKYSVMASIWCCMTSFYDLHPFCRWHASPQQSTSAYPRLESVTFSNMSSRRKSFMGNSYMLVTCIHDRWCATVFSTPFYP